MVTFWQHHPSLSYLFSGRFIGPTSQAPRVDEGPQRQPSTRLEIAFAELGPPTGPDVPPWLVDRFFRHLLVDLTGNTHRAEFCIDKLFSPDSERGRLGILELRAFEMPPHPQMALVQSLLVRALVARFWEEPYAGPLVRWGTELHDRYLLPCYVARRHRTRSSPTCRHGIAFDIAGSNPSSSSGSRSSATVEGGDVRLELRNAIEPWHVLGEEVAGSGTARYVDSSVERLQVRSRVQRGRHILTCNSVPVPLQPTSTSGTGVAGVRFGPGAPGRRCIPRSMRTVRSCSISSTAGARSRSADARTTISHPGGRSYDTFPVNSAEAEARRYSRFFKHGHTPGHVDVAELDRFAAAVPREYSRTLDLRRHAPAE